MSEVENLSSAQSGPYTLPGTLDDVLRAYQGWLARTAKGMVRQSPMYEWTDVAQEGALAICRAYKSFDGSRPAEFWFKFKARNAMLDTFKLSAAKHMRSERPVHAALLNDALTYEMLWDALAGATEIDFDASVHSEEIFAAVAELPEEQRRYVLARFYVCLNERELTAFMGRQRPANTYWHGRYSAKKRLAEKLAHLIA